jgi:hypothetical protein
MESRAKAAALAKLLGAGNVAPPPSSLAGADATIVASLRQRLAKVPLREQCDKNIIDSSMS